LELVAIEHYVGDFKLDILCTDGAQQVEPRRVSRRLRLVRRRSCHGNTFGHLENLWR